MNIQRAEASLNDIAGPVWGEGEVDPMGGRLTDLAATRRFLFAGHALITLVSERTGQRYTFKISAPKTPNPASPVFFVSLLSGPDNTADYTYLGTLFGDGRDTATRFRLTRKSSMRPDSGPVRAFDYLITQLIFLGQMPAGVTIYHEGRCGRCGRRLTVPESITSGFGPECIQIMAGGR
jgi:hypothetical protein